MSLFKVVFQYGYVGNSFSVCFFVRIHFRDLAHMVDLSLFVSSEYFMLKWTCFYVSRFLFPLRKPVEIEIFAPRHAKFSKSFKKNSVLLDTMSNGIPSKISLDNAVVAQDEMGRPFIIVREYVPLDICL